MTTSDWPRVPAVSSITYGSTVPLPSGATLTLGLSSDVAILNSLVNLTGAPVRFNAAAGGAEVIIAPAEVPLRAEVRRERVAVMLVDLVDASRAERGQHLLLMPNAAGADAPAEEEAPTTATIQVFKPPTASGFVRPLPELGLCTGVLVSAETGAALDLLGSPYDATTKQPAAKRARRARIPVYSADVDDDGSIYSLVRYRTGL